MVLKVAVIVGARPQFIKAAVVSRAFREHRPDAEELLIHTGQHYDANMSDVFFGELDIPEPGRNLGIGGGSHGRNTGRMIEKIEEVLLVEQPDWVLVYGDTDSTLSGALAAVKLNVPVAHVEAGLRSFNRRMPEEINRVLVDHAADLLFTPTDAASANLKNEGIGDERIRQVGDVMHDAALYYAERAEQRSGILDELRLASNSFVLVTVHRAENTNDPTRLRGILAGLAESDRPAVWPIHPRTRQRLAGFGLGLPANVRAVDPVGYLDMVMLERNAAVIATDSGGVQKEAFFHRTPCVTLREETEWVELVEAGCNRLVGTAADAVAQGIAECETIAKRCWPAGLYGDGNAGVLIAQSIDLP